MVFKLLIYDNINYVNLYILFLILFLLLKIQYKNKELFQNSKKKIYLVSNDKKINKNIFNKIKKNDLIVFMNTSFHCDNDHIKENEKILFLRANKDSFFGYKKIFFLFNNLNNAKIDKKHMKLFVNFKENKEIINFTKIIDKEIKFPEKKSPTTGFITYLYLKKIYPMNKIILIGFYGPHKKYKGFSEHNFNFEQNYYMSKNVLKLD